MKRGCKDKKRRQDSAAECTERRNARTDEQQIVLLDKGNHRAEKERFRLSQRIWEKNHAGEFVPHSRSKGN